MADMEELRVEVSALRMLFEAALRREWDAQNRDPQWPDTLRVFGLQDVDRRYATDPLRQDIRLKLVEITQKALA